MVKRMLIDATHPEETRVVVLDGEKVEEFDFESVNKRQIAGNIYLAKVTRIEPSLQAAFVDYGGNRHGFLPFAEIHPDYYQIPKADREAVIEAEAEEREARAQNRAEAAEEASRGPELEEVVEETEAEGTEAEGTAEGGETAGEGVTAEAAATRAPMEAEEAAGTSIALEAAGSGDAVRSEPVTAQPEVGHEEATGEVAGPVEGETAPASPSAPAVPGMDVIDLAEHEEAPLIGEPLGTADAGIEAAAEGGTPETALAGEAGESAGEAVAAPEGKEDEERDKAPAPRQQKPRRRYKIQEVIKVRQIMLVQVVKEERGNKGAALTTYLSLAGRYCVLMPNTPRGGGISRKITNAADRKKLKAIADEIKLPDGSGLIIRTAGAKRTKSEIKRDYEYLLRQWDQIRELTLRSIAPAPIYEEGNLIKRAIRDLYTRDIEEILVEGEQGYRTAKDFMRMLIPSHAKKVKHYTDPVPLFSRYQVENYLASMFNPTVRLPSGGYIVIDTTEALVAIDVNSGKSTRQGSIEETALKTNLEAAEEIARQLKLRDLAGLIVIDFIDMDDRRNRAAVEKRLKEKLKNDRARIQVGRISSFGLLEMSRQRLRPGMLEMVSQPCPHCHGTGIIRSDESLALAILREIEEEAVKGKHDLLTIAAPVSVANYLINEKRGHILGIEERYGITVKIDAEPSLVAPDYRIDKARGQAEVAARRPVVSIDSTLAGPASVVEEVREEIGTPAIDSGENGSEEAEGSGRKRKRRRRSRKRSGRGNGNGSASAETAVNDEKSNTATEDEAKEGETPAEAESTASASEGRSDAESMNASPEAQPRSSEGAVESSEGKSDGSDEASDNVADKGSEQAEASEGAAEAETSEEPAKPVRRRKAPRKRTRKPKEGTEANVTSSADSPAVSEAAAAAPVAGEGPDATPQDSTQTASDQELATAPSQLAGSQQGHGEADASPLAATVEDGEKG